MVSSGAKGATALGGDGGGEEKNAAATGGEDWFSQNIRKESASKVKQTGKTAAFLCHALEYFIF